MNQNLFPPRTLFFLAILTLKACINTDTSSASSETTGGSSPASKKTGMTIFEQNCKICHGSDGRLGLNGAKDLSKSQLSLSDRVSIITNGKNLMTPFGKILSSSEIDSVAAFTLRLKL